MNRRLYITIVLIIGLIITIKAESTGQVLMTDNVPYASIIKKYYPSDSIDIYISKGEFYKDDTLKLMGISTLVIPYTCRVIFADLHPGANWEHECEYLLISSDPEQVSIYREKMPPRQILDFFDLVQKQEIYQLGKIIEPKYNPSLQVKKKRHNQQDSPVIHNKYAVIISGGGDPYYNHVRYWNDCSAMYQTLIANGYDKENIYVAISDGTNPNADMRIGDYNYISSPLDLDGDGEEDIQYAATYNNITHIFENLSYQMTEHDDLFVFVTDHGGQIANMYSYIVLWGESILEDYDFAHMLMPIQARTINIVMEQCYSGGFIDDLRGMNNVVIATACDANEVSYSRKDGTYNEFVYYWLSGINGFVPSYMYPYYTSPIINNNADTNNDGYVSMKEAAIYATTYDTANEHPQLESYPDCLSHELTLNYLLNLCYDGLLVSGWDLYMKDNVADIGEEPNQTTEYSWISDDIWVEENGQRVDILQSGQTYDVCVRIRNRGTEASEGTATLYVHWAKAHIGGTWPWGWYDTYEYECGESSVRRGEMFGSMILPQIEGGETYVARIPWTTPESGEYSPCIEFAGDNLAELWHYCLLARIVDDQEQPDENITNLGLREFVLNYNNVISRNVTIMDLQEEENLSPKLTGIVGLTNPMFDENSGPYTLRCQVYSETEWEHDATILLTFTSHFFGSQSLMTWQNCYTTNIYGRFYLSDSATFSNIYFLGGQEAISPVKLEVIYLDTYEEGNYPEFTISLDLIDSQGLIVGGEIFRFRNERPDLANILQSTTLENTTGQQEAFFAKQGSIDVYNIQGQHLTHCEECDLESLNLSSGIYILQVNVDAKSYYIKIIK